MMVGGQIGLKALNSIYRTGNIASVNFGVTLFTCGLNWPYNTLYAYGFDREGRQVK